VVNKLFKWAAASVIVAASIAMPLSRATAQDAEESFFKGKTVRIVVGYGPGGGYDVYARMIAPYLGKTLGATIVVENQPGAGGLTALNRTYTAPPDGLTMMIVNGAGAALAQLVEQSSVRYDLGKLGHLGTVSASRWIWLVGANNTSINTPQDALKAGKQMMWSGSGPMDGLSDGAAFTCEALGLNCRIVMGYPGSNEAALAVTKGEMDAIYVSDTSANNYVKSGQNKPIATMARKRSRFFPDQPTIFEAVNLTPDQQWLFDFRANVEDLGRILVVPPGLPPARLAFMQEAVKKALTDPALVAEGEKGQRYFGYEDADTTRKRTLAVVTELTPEQRARVKAILTKAQN
jgi:tripartite-type tricarboxylate transporter receptor subunit TctC